ncbi:MAG: hypothetical protein SF028_07995 [Candidatus Sumerlaeia bacterium]|nr:hypothetical protein [Candidatus Sumerlaeia bacterium]
MTTTPLRILAAALLLALWSAAAHAQSALTVLPQAGYDGFFRAGAWTPVIVRVTNQPSSGKPGDRDLDFAGRLVVRSTPEEEGMPAFDFSRDIEVPGFSSKVFFVYAKFPTDPNPNPPVLELRSDTGRLLSTYALNGLQTISESRTLVATLDAGNSSLQLPRLRSDLEYETRTRLGVDTLPDHWAGYDGADALVLPQWEEGKLTAPVREALMHWVAMGGHLVLLGGRHTGSYPPDGSPLLAAALDGSFRLVATQQGLAYEELGRDNRPEFAGEDTREESYIASRITPRDPSAQVLLATAAGEPLFIRERHGKGWLYFLAFDLETIGRNLDQRLASAWFGALPVPNLADHRFSYVGTLKRGWTQSDAPDAADGLRVLSADAGSPPNYLIISFICVVYAIVIGPLHFYLLGKRQRYELAWGTIPALVIVFSVLIYGLGRLTRGGLAIHREVALLETAAGESTGSLRRTAAVFTPNELNLSAFGAGTAPTLSDESRWSTFEGGRSFTTGMFGAFGQNVAPASGEAPQIVAQGGEVLVRSWRLRPYEVALLQERGPAELGGAVTAELRGAGAGGPPRLEGAVRNGTGMDFDEAYVVVSENSYALGPLAAGGEAALTESTAPKALVALLNEMALPPGEGEEAARQLNRYNAAVAVKSYFYPPVSGTSSFKTDPSGAWLIGLAYDGEPALRADIPDAERSEATVLLVRLPLPRPSSAEASVRLLGTAANSTFEFDALGRVRFHRSSFTVAFDPPEAAGVVLRPESLVLEVNDKPGTNQRLVYEAYDFAGPGWVRLGDGREKSLAPRGPGQMLSSPATGRVFLRATSEDATQDSNFGMFEPSEIRSLTPRFLYGPTR